MIRLLDHGFCRLVSYTQPVPQPIREFDSLEARHGEIIGHKRPVDWTADLEIIRNARVSHDADWRQDDTVLHEAHCVAILPPMSNGEARPCNCTPRTVSDSRLMDYLYSHVHSTPFESVSFTFEVQAPIFVFRQWHRHRTWSYNEVSARYTELPSTCYVPHAEDIGTQDAKNKQGRTFPIEIAEGYAERDRQRAMVEGFEIESRNAHATHQDRLGEGVPREIARINLPLSTYSRMFGTVSLWNLFRFLNLRDHANAQYEIRVYAQALKELIRPIVPEAMRVYDRFKQVTIDMNEEDQIVTLPNGERARILMIDRPTPWNSEVAPIPPEA